MNNHSLPYYIGGLCLWVALIFGTTNAFAQGVSVSETDAPPHPSAMLDVQSVNKGMLVPRMNLAQRLAIASPANGLMVYQIANLAQGGVLYRRGFWYWDGVQNKWVYLGDERTGVVDQAANTIESTQGDIHLALPDEGQNTILWLTPFNSPPTVLVVPEFTALASPPDISEYCQPDYAVCNAATKILSWALYYPDFAEGPASPPMLSWLAHGTCAGTDNTGTSNNTSYKHLPYPIGTVYTSVNNSFNSGTVDLCADPSGTIGAWVRVSNGLNRSFRFYIDKNQDGDFDDPGEAIGVFENQVTTGANQFRWGSANLPMFVLPPDIVNGVTKMRMIMRLNSSLSPNPCYAGDTQTSIYDMDINILCGGGGQPLYPNDLNWCNVDDVTATTARVSCFDKNGTAADTKYHYKVIPQD